MANKKSTTSKKKKKKNTSDGTMKYFLVLVIAGIAIALLVFMQKKGEGNGDLTGTPTTAPTGITPEGTQVPDETPTGTPAKEPTAAPTITTAPTTAPTTTPTAAPTKTPTKAPTATPEPTEEPEPTPGVDVLSAEDAQTLVRVSVSDKYSIQLINDHLFVGDKEYYQFCALDGDNEMLYPFLAVDKLGGGLYCYDAYENEITVFTEFPLKSEGNTQITPVPEVHQNISADEAYEILCSYTKESLNIAKEAVAYDAEYGSELTFINGDNCYRINLFEVLDSGKVRSCGEFYISIDGTKCYYIDSETNEFVLVQK